jgi:hypothetical protein
LAGKKSNGKYQLHRQSIRQPAKMKQKPLTIAVVSGLVCVVLALAPVRSALYFTAVYVGLSVCALAALVCVKKPLRWFPSIALLGGLLGIFITWQDHALDKTHIKIPTQQQPAGTPTWIQWSSTAGGNDHYYAMTPSPTNWVAAEKQAESWGGTLATITSAREQTFVNDTILIGKFEHLPVWIGLVRRPLTEKLRRGLWELGLHVKVPPKMEFQWVTGEDFLFAYWSQGEPNNFGSGESYVAMNWGYSANPPRGIKGDWNDTPLNGFGGFGGNTGGPYFGLVELSQPAEPALTPSRWGLATLVVLTLAAARAYFFRFGREPQKTDPSQPV